MKREDIISKMAEAIFAARNGERNRRQFNEQKEPYLKDAEAALDAFLGEFKKVKLHDGSYNGTLEDYLLQKCNLETEELKLRKLYKQILGLKK